jgi:hypothetical protein
MRFAETAALFHDIGRFEQLVRYGTFSDHHSVNHAELGVSVLESEGVLAGLQPEDRDGLGRVIRNHNRFAISEGESGFHLAQSRLLRDADKLDIFRILIDFYRNGGGENSTVALGLSDSDAISPAVSKILPGVCRHEPSPAPYLLLSSSLTFQPLPGDTWRPSGTFADRFGKRMDGYVRISIRGAGIRARLKPGENSFRLNGADACGKSCPKKSSPGLRRTAATSYPSGTASGGGRCGRSFSGLSCLSNPARRKR